MSHPLPVYIQSFLGGILQHPKKLFKSWEEDKPKEANPETAKRLRTAINALELSLNKIIEGEAVETKALIFIANQGLLVEVQLAQMMREFKFDQEALILDIQAYQFALKMTTENITVHVYNSIVNSLAYYSNQAEMGSDLIKLYEEITPLIKVLPEMKENGEQYEIFKLLIFNYAIIATRTLDPKRMEQGLNILVKHLPNDIKHFLEQGMSQMETIGYPTEICDVMGRFYLEYATPKVMH